MNQTSSIYSQNAYSAAYEMPSRAGAITPDEMRPTGQDYLNWNSSVDHGSVGPAYHAAPALFSNPMADPSPRLVTSGPRGWSLKKKLIVAAASAVGLGLVVGIPVAVTHKSGGSGAPAPTSFSAGSMLSSSTGLESTSQTTPSTFSTVTTTSQRSQSTGPATSSTRAAAPTGTLLPGSYALSLTLSNKDQKGLTGASCTETVTDTWTVQALGNDQYKVAPGEENAQTVTAVDGAMAFTYGVTTQSATSFGCAVNIANHATMQLLGSGFTGRVVSNTSVVPPCTGQVSGAYIACTYTFSAS